MDATMQRAAAPTLAVLRRISSEQLTAATPCTEYDVRALISHLLQWGPMMAGAGRRQTVGSVADDAGDDWLSAIEKQTADVVDAWSGPGAWEGTAPMGGPVPAMIVGGLVAAEFVVHGWDLARATGVDVSWPDDVIAVAYEATAATAEQGRAMGMYAPPVELAPEASAMDRLLAISGRNPQWTPYRSAQVRDSCGLGALPTPQLSRSCADLGGPVRPGGPEVTDCITHFYKSVIYLDGARTR